MECRAFLVEIGTEELPPNSLETLSTAFGEGLEHALKNGRLKHGKVECFATPRRLAVLVHGLVGEQATQQMQRRGPALNAARSGDGKWTRAAEGFARSCGVTADDLEILETAQGTWLAHTTVVPGRPVVELLPDIVNDTLAGLPVQKRMRWGDKRQEFIRPVRWVLMLYGESPVPGQIMGLSSSRESRGHRFHHPQSLSIPEASQYESILENQGKVIASFNKRRSRIQSQLDALGTAHQELISVDPELLNEVTALNEWPVALRGRFDEEFLEVPTQALISSMQAHQKYFPIRDDTGALLPAFAFIANIESSEPEAVIRGNERVIRPRLSDAAFFFKQDMQVPLADRLTALERVVFQESLGTLADRSRRISELSASIAIRLQVGSTETARRAGLLAKADLTSQMVLEFPELQGTMGRYYALGSGESEAVALAIEEHYLPRYAGDRLPANSSGSVVALAEKFDTLVGIFGIGQIPSGTRDPFGLRRAALGILRILVEQAIPLDLEWAVGASQAQYGATSPASPLPVVDYVLDRFKARYAEQNLPAEYYLAVRCLRPVCPLDFDRRVQAVAKFMESADASTLIAVNKRVANILAKDHSAERTDINPALLQEKAELALHELLQVVAMDAAPYLDAGEYGKALELLSKLGTVLDDFFDQVMVNSDDKELRSNRLALLNAVRTLFLRIADISQLQGLQA